MHAYIDTEKLTRKGVKKIKSELGVKRTHALPPTTTQTSEQTPKKNDFDLSRARTCNLLIRSQAPCHWAIRPSSVLRNTARPDYVALLQRYCATGERMEPAGRHSRHGSGPYNVAIVGTYMPVKACLHTIFLTCVLLSSRPRNSPQKRHLKHDQQTPGEGTSKEKLAGKGTKQHVKWNSRLLK